MDLNFNKTITINFIIALKHNLSESKISGGEKRKNCMPRENDR
jgi:hypothetical protein